MSAMWTREGPYVFEWADIGRALDAVHTAVVADGFKPTVVYGVARGGLIAASYLYSVLDVPRTVSVRVRRTVNDEQYASKQIPRIEAAGPLELKPEDQVLVVDDIVGTGATAEVVSEHLTELGVREHRIAALVRNHRCPTPVHYCGFVADDWVVFPWESGAVDRPDGWRPVPWAS